MKNEGSGGQEGVIDSRREQILQEIDNLYLLDNIKQVAKAIS